MLEVFDSLPVNQLGGASPEREFSSDRRPGPPTARSGVRARVGPRSSSWRRPDASPTFFSSTC